MVHLIPKSAKRALKKLKEKERKRDITYKAARIIEGLAMQCNAVVAIGNVHRGKRGLIEGAGKCFET
ncbi:hypothetical protein B6U99_05280 [Candidatus Geothermarchaeota archaeon ex4572_27]|nr:MAG: hypothetical protein B6U99_05280 [Candidatus Geothermarchaeota archaeon ex4572_27]